MNCLTYLPQLALDNTAKYESSQADDILRLINISSCTERRLRFFSSNPHANNLLFQLTSAFMISGSLKCQTARLLINQNHVEGYTGDWFLMRLDWYVLSTVLLSSTLLDEGAGVYRNLLFFTAGIGSLYPNDDTATDDAVAEDEEFYGLDLVLHDIELAHGRNYATALYYALRHQESQTEDVNGQDVSYALAHCSFRMVLKEFISLDDLSDNLCDRAETLTGKKLDELIGTLLSPLPESDGQVFYYIAKGTLEEEDSDESVNGLDLGSLPSNDIDHNIISRQQKDEEGDEVPQKREPDQQAAEQSPMFFKIFLNGVAASSRHFRVLKQR